jgi:hypothetical protein
MYTHNNKFYPFAFDKVELLELYVVHGDFLPIFRPFWCFKRSHTISHVVHGNTQTPNIHPIFFLFKMKVNEVKQK